ncbi:Asp-tRNA(Asn)/Glu-tRNA(Gln) amidotransferase subunit GatB [Patescibacteria group bacterium]|nr:Asp-tRNA(Asn)/Glu-tRNA(Gln) amidotransferase subunit GatB [Patescibacteria group bacterium]MBU1705592.1 Asp-tRNA(Asn)/Glu-tRNA(Gln) amidotransferase subunit GatB [Patescibacteria group bacterium]
MPTLEPVIGLEIHIQLKTKSKMFCGCATHDSAVAPNTNICPICLGHPGTLPVPNEQAVRSAILIGLALNCEIASHSKFDRKNYFYPDLPKGYQISQFDLPVAAHGHLTVSVPGPGGRTSVRIDITRAHLEEDAAKNLHHAETGKTYVDYNRGGTPLVEIVTEPDFTSPAQAKAFLQELRLIARYLNISDADMEKGHLRCDANISMRQRDAAGAIVGPRFHPKTEIKNLNSFKHVERALEYEIQRQTKLWESDAPPAESTTRGWDDVKQKTVEQRTKEGSADYRYFPEPDIPPLELTALAEELRSQIPELPAARRARFIDEYGLRPEDAAQICEDKALSEFTEQAFSELHAWLKALPELDDVQDEIMDKEKTRIAKLFAGWLLSKLGGLLADRGMAYKIMMPGKAGSGYAGKITPENFAEFITLIATGKLSSKSGLAVLGKMLDDGDDPSHIMEDLKLGKMEDAGALADIIDRLLANHPEEVARYQAGKTELLQLFIGLVLKETEGTADPKLTANILKVKLES